MTMASCANLASSSAESGVTEDISNTEIATSIVYLLTSKS